MIDWLKEVNCKLKCRGEYELNKEFQPYRHTAYFHYFRIKTLLIE